MTYESGQLTVEYYQDELYGDVLKIWPADKTDSYKITISAKEGEHKEYDTLPEAITAYRNSSMKNTPTEGMFKRCEWHEEDGKGVCEDCSKAAYDAAEDWVAERDTI